ncbi:MAG: Bor family protein [Bacteroidales bacterium]|nr:Bor family protein [Bacteroidales bacterium]
MWGLVPINEVDSHEMAQGHENYQIESEISFIDFLIGAVLGFATIQTQTVTVTY